VVSFQARREEEATNVVDDERRRLRRNHKRPEGLQRQQPNCGVSAPRRHLSPRHFSLHLDHCRHNAAAQVLLGVLNGQPWKKAAGLNCPRDPVSDHLDAEYAVVDLSRDPPAESLVKATIREMRIRFYQPNTIKAYRSALVSFLRWHRGRLDQITKEDIRDYLELLVTGGASSSHVSVTLSALRTTFDKFCLLRCTVGLVTPRKPKRLPVVLSQQEVQRLISSASSFRDKLLISVLYATGLRVSEVARLSWTDLDFDRRQVRVEGGKGRKDRYVMLAEHLIPLLRQVWRFTKGEGYLFPAEGKRTTDRHLSPRTIERAV